MVKAIRMPDLHQFKPGFFDLSARCGGWELEHLIIVREAFLPHGCLRFWQGSVPEAGDWLHFRMVPIPLLAPWAVSIRCRGVAWLRPSEDRKIEGRGSGGERERSGI